MFSKIVTDLKRLHRGKVRLHPGVWALSLIGLALALSVAVVLAVHDEGLFELGDGTSPGTGSADILGSVSQPGPDWADVFDANGNVVSLFGGVAAAFIMDDLSQSSAVDQSTFSGAGGSNKNNDAISPADCAARVPPLTGSACDPWHWDTGNVPAKDDLANVYAYATLSGTHLIIYAGFERLDPSGDSHIDLEFFQSQIALDEAAPCNDAGPDVTPCEFTGIRTVGDIIVSMDFRQGGALGEVTIRRWDGSQYVLIDTIGGEGCDAADNACAFNNGGTIPGGPWPNFDRHGATITDLPANAFTEFGADSTALVGGTPCITSFMGKTRSSASFTAELKDFAGPVTFPICGASISIAPNDVNEIGASHTFTVTVNKKLGAQSLPAPDGTVVTVTLTDANGAVSNVSTNTCASPGTSGGQCTVTFTSNSAGTVTGHAAADVVVGNLTIHVQTDGTGSNSGDAVKRFVDAFITIAPNDTNSVGENHTFTITVKQNDGLGGGFVNAPNGTIVGVTLTDSGGAVSSISSNTCASPGISGGTCTVTFTSNTAGTVTGHASVTFSVGGVSLTRQTDGTGQNSGDATKVFVAGSLAWFKRDNAGQLQGGATFQVCRTHDRFGTDIPDECVNVTDNSSPDADADAGEFLLTGLALGRYTVDETVAPPGFVGDPKVETVELTLGSPNVTISQAFVNQRPIVKLTEFGYTNAPTGTPTAGVVSGSTTYTVKLKNFGGASTSLSGSLVVSNNVSCTGGNTLAISATLTPNQEQTSTLTCTYSNLADGDVVTANLTADYTTNGLTRTASGTPASISFTVQSD